MTSPLPYGVGDQFERSIQAALQRFDTESYNRPRSPFDETKPIWILDVLPQHLAAYWCTLSRAVARSKYHLKTHPSFWRRLITSWWLLVLLFVVLFT